MPDSLRKLAAARNHVSMKKAVQQLTDLLRKQTKDKPDIDIAAIASGVRILLDSIKPRLDEARTLIGRAEKRRNEGTLDDRALLAEIVPGQTLILLHETLELLFIKASDGKDVYSMRCLRIASSILSSRASDLVQEANLSTALSDIRELDIKKTISMAQCTYDDVVEALDTAPSELGITVPVFLSYDM